MSYDRIVAPRGHCPRGHYGMMPLKISPADNADNHVPSHRQMPWHRVAVPYAAKPRQTSQGRAAPTGSVVVEFWPVCSGCPLSGSLALCSTKTGSARRKHWDTCETLSVHDLIPHYSIYAANRTIRGPDHVFSGFQLSTCTRRNWFRDNDNAVSQNIRLNDRTCVPRICCWNCRIMHRIE